MPLSRFAPGHGHAEAPDPVGIGDLEHGKKETGLTEV